VETHRPQPWYGFGREAAEALIQSAAWQSWCQALMHQYMALSDGYDTARTEEERLRLQAQKWLMRTLIEQPYKLAMHSTPFERLYAGLHRTRTYSAEPPVSQSEVQVHETVPAPPPEARRRVSASHLA
jgi:hypothetical protein